MSTTNLYITPASDEVGVGQARRLALNLRSGTLTLVCLVAEKRVVYGRTEYLITPVEGEGEAWVNEAALHAGKGSPVQSVEPAP